MNTKEKYELADMVTDHAIKSGAIQASVTIDESRRNDIDIRDQKIDKLTESVRNGLTVELFVDGKYSSHSTSRLKKEELFRFIEEAIAATRYLAEDEFRSLPDPELYYKGGGKELQVLDPKIDTLDAKSKIVLARQVCDEAFQKDERIISVTSSYSDRVSHRVKVTSNGFRGDSGSSNVSLSAEVSVKGETGRPSDYWYENAIFLNDLVKSGIGSKALERALNKLGPKKIKSGKYTVLVENRSLYTILNPLASALQGASLYQKQSFFIGKENKSVAAERLTITDDPFIRSGFGSSLFDNEGLATAKRPIIENGILKNFYIDTYYGKKLKMNPTSGNSTNILFTAGKRDLKSLIESMGKGVFITGFNGGNCNGSTGDFSYGLEGFYVENGKIIHPVNEMNITGNMNGFWFSLAELGNDILENRPVKAPSMLFENVDLSGI
jgi:PmbA protein